MAADARGRAQDPEPQGAGRADRARRGGGVLRGRLPGAGRSRRHGSHHGLDRPGQQAGRDLPAVPVEPGDDAAAGLCAVPDRRLALAGARERIAPDRAAADRVGLERAVGVAEGSVRADGPGGPELHGAAGARVSRHRADGRGGLVSAGGDRGLDVARAAAEPAADPRPQEGSAAAARTARPRCAAAGAGRGAGPLRARAAGVRVRRARPAARGRRRGVPGDAGGHRGGAADGGP